MSDYPDWFGQPQITKRGIITYLSGGAVVSTTDRYELISLSRQGIVYGGYITTHDFQAKGEDKVHLTIDGHHLISNNWNSFQANGWVIGSNQLMYIVKYDLDHPWFSVVLRDGLVFDNSVVMEYEAADVNARTIYCKLYYGLIES